MGLVFGTYREKKSDMDVLMDRMRITPSGNPKTELLKVSVTKDVIDDILNAGRHPGGVGQHPQEVSKSIEIQTQLRDVLGVDLAGYFDAEVSLRDRDAIVRVFYRGHALGIGVGDENNLVKPFKDAINAGIIPSLKQLHTDLDKILKALNWS